MESCKLRTLMLLEIHLLWVCALSVQGHRGPEDQNVIDLLAALNMSRHMSAVSRLSPDSAAYRIRPRAAYLTLPREYSHFLLSNLRGGMGVHVVGHQAPGSSATLFSLSSASSPILQIVSSSLDDTLRLEHRAGGARDPTSFHFPGRNPFSSEEWVQLAVSLEADRLAFFVDCREAVVLPIKSDQRVDLELPQDVVVTLAGTPGKKDSRFSGYLKTAEVSVKAYSRRPWLCDNVTDSLPPSRHTDDSPTHGGQMFQQDASSSKPHTGRRPKDKTSHYPPDVQSDQLQRGVALGPPGSPQGVKSDSEAQKDDRLKKLEKKLEELVGELDLVKTQNADLQSRVQNLEGCECVRRRCVWEGREVEDGQQWQTDLNTVCTCTSGKVACRANIKDPCLSNPCQNGGVCSVLTSDPAGFHCSCPPDTKGPACHGQLRQACWAPKPENHCEDLQPFQRHWAFNPSSGLCEDFLYCTGNSSSSSSSSNSFPSFKACRDQCMLGACCLRKPRQALNTSQHGSNISSVNETLLGYNQLHLEGETWYSDVEFNQTELRDPQESPMKVNCHEDVDSTFTCDYLTRAQCQALVEDGDGEARVMSFSPGVKCSDGTCGGGCGGLFPHKLWSHGKRFRQACGECMCTCGGSADCVCKHLTQRKEIRDLTQREMRLYQRAVRKLHTRPGCEPDGTVQNVSHSKLDSCQTCVCEGGNRECHQLPCPELDCTQKETVPGDCCQRCKGCIYSGVRYDHGAKWRPAERPCDVCSCSEGRVRCERERCASGCKNPAAPPDGACCPVCHGCGVNGHDVPNGAVVVTHDPCEQCSCENGDVFCTPLPCPALTCRNPVRRPGDCCPRCEQCEYESTIYLDGQKFSSRRDPCLRCRCAAGQVSCERTESSCPAPPCSHPARRKGECCPTCDECEYDGRVYADGKGFVPAGSGPCLQCRCKGGNVICHEEKCPPVLCSNPIIDPHLCCPICKACVLDGVEYEDGSSWQREGLCSSCTCESGEPLCTPTRCPSTDCLHPTKLSGSCCAACNSCTYNHRIYSDGQRFATPDRPCHICTCQRGSVECERRPCPPLNCSTSHTPPGECCPKCPDCSFENRVFVDGEAFLNPLSVCEECRCVSGAVDCHRAQCPRPRCNAPLPGNCCQNSCNGCSYAGKEYPNGQEFPHPTDACRSCSCINGNVQCLMKRCPPLSCSDPNVLPGDCCPRCPAPPSDCVYEQRSYRHTERFYHPTDSCQSCACVDGAVHCQRKPCPFAACSHPITQECCRTCEGCLHEGRERADGETWDDASDPCAVCFCRGGSVGCERRRCPPADCKHPVQRQCCRSCDGCMFRGEEHPDGTEFADAKDPCAVCYCYGGEVVCTQMPCYGECSHPHKPAGRCCGECDRCFYNGALLANGQSVPDPGNLCSECTCQSGSVRCARKSCPAAACPHPVTDPCGCPVCNHGCHFSGATYADGQILPGGEGGCQDCTCSRGEVACAPRRCPAVSCPHPALDGCGCGVCDGCSFHGRGCFSGERFPDPGDRCQLCSCLNGGVACVRVSCPSVSCVHPLTPPGECCPVCTGMCRHHGREHQSGSSFASPADPCSSCSCLNEVVTCQRRPCPVQCSHPVPSEACCPVCDSCLYEGVVHAHSRTFTPASTPCQRCACVRGTVTCVALVCPPTPCVRPVSRAGQCCPECTGCTLNGQEFSDGQTWSLSSNHCSTCICQAGEVRCASPECPKLPCMHQVTDPGACCPRCRGCMYGGEEHPEGSSWFADSTPCMTCMCVGGVTTCSEVRCLSPCINFISVPGECCPVCADCVFEGRIYGSGESFHPAGDPCQICTCEVMPDGEQHLRCYRKQCPSLVDCPKSNILFSGPDSCCPVCAQPLSNCTAALIGNEVLATDDPCFTCHCQDLTWTCLHQICLPLTCPRNEQFTPADSCCPVCKDCVIEGQNRRVANGSSWTDSDDDCVTCTCNLGYVECSIDECLPAVCLDDQKQVKIPGKCCHECQDSGVSCSYQGTLYRSNQQWEVDECSSCTCVSGDVHCHTERCPPLTCATDEMPAIVPGVCCPHCLPRPATCIAFGDPHYRTFDGRMLHFQGACTYVLAQDCEGGDFSIHVTNDDRGRKGVSWTKEVTVFIGDVTVELLQDWIVKVNGEAVALPFLTEPYIYVERQTNTILLNTNIGLKVLWSGRSHLEVSVPGSYKGHTCGLCGNFNNYYQDDLRMPSGRISLSESDFGNSWKVTNGSRSLPSCSPGEDIDPCKDAGYQAKKGANARCKVLKSAAFKPCHRVVPPDPWYGACVYDLCACGANTDECLCDALEAYASQCREAGVVLQWRSPSLCAVGCPAERGFVFDECGPPCPINCFNVDVPLGVIESHCFKPCVPGCQCPAGLVLHNNQCIQPDKCPKVIHGSPS